MGGKDLLEDERLRSWAEQIDKINWSALVLDKDARLVYISDEAREFVATEEDSDLGEGLHIVEAFTKPAWLNTVPVESQIEMFNDLAPFIVTDYTKSGRNLADVLPETLVPLLEHLTPKEPPLLWSSTFLYLAPGGDRELPDYRVNVCYFRLNDDSGDLIGWIIVFLFGLRPNLLALLARGHESMYERMAKLIEPAPHEAAVLFVDLHHSGRLSRRLPSAAYFKLVRRLWTGFDAAVDREKGIIGKHAGDGASAFFLVDDTGSPSEAAAAALRASRAIHEVSHEVFREVVDSDCLMKVGVHWGGGLYMGQLVPGGRLDVTALGDEVNEAARIQEVAGPGETLASKQLLERLTADDAAALGLDLEKISYRPLAEVDNAGEKAIRDAGGVAVTQIPD